ncbi:N-acetyltransferase [Allosphingosinicella sp.]|jgi:GNAT superfamily N-acetyltransferase|uniref:N-acetyltransferase n=1 Tax=Allosphingosinicella sp. TaxID=2823234 RepID=UPI002F006A13
MSEPIVRPVSSSADRRAFVELAYRLNRDDPNWVPPLRSEVFGLITPGKNPWFEHAEAQLFMATRGGRPVGRISAQVDRLVLEHMGEGTGQWGMFEAADAETAAALIAAAEGWLRDKGMSRSLGPFSLSIWDEPGLLIEGHDHPPTVMMGHNSPAYEAWMEAAGYRKVKDLHTYDIDITQDFPPVVARMVRSGERNPSIRVRTADKSKFEEEARIILEILNDAWADNWGFIPLTDSEIAYAGKKLKPIIWEELVRIAELDGEAVAFMIAVPNVNEYIADLGGRLFPFGWAKLLWRLRNPRTRTNRVPLMGVVRRFRGTRTAAQLALMMIEYIRRVGAEEWGATRTEIGWILEDNHGMKAIAEMIESRINRVYRIYQKPL